MVGVARLVEVLVAAWKADREEGEAAVRAQVAGMAAVVAVLVAGLEAVAVGQVVVIKVANQLVLMMCQAIATKIITRTFQHLILVLNLLHARNVYLQLNVNGPMDFCFLHQVDVKLWRMEKASN